MRLDEYQAVGVLRSVERVESPGARRRVSYLEPKYTDARPVLKLRDLDSLRGGRRADKAYSGRCLG